MVFDLNDARLQYQNMLERFRSTQDEGLLMSFNELGMTLNRAGIPPELAVETHAIAIQTLQTKNQDWPYQDNTLLMPLMEVIMAYGVTFRHQLFAQQQAADAQFYQVLEQSSDMVFITDPDGLISYANPAYRLAMAPADRDVEGTRPLFVDSQECSSPAELWATLEVGQTFKGIVASVGREHTPRFWSISAFPIFNDGDSQRPSRYVFLADDISRQLAVKKRLRRSERLTTLGEIASGVSHEFNNILLIISGFAELVKEDSGSLTTGDFADEILKAVGKGRNLNQQILSFAKDREVEGKPARLGSMIERIQPLVQTAVGGDIRLTFDCPDDLIVTLSEDHLCQILMNLCINARHAIHERGNPSDGQVQCWFQADGGMLTFMVRDNGNGMTEEVLGSIFEPFFTTKRTGEGSGLGLSIIMRIVDQYKGHVDVSSEPGIGTQFKLSIPVVYGN